MLEWLADETWNFELVLFYIKDEPLFILVHYTYHQLLLLLRIVCIVQQSLSGYTWALVLEVAAKLFCSNLP